METNEKSRVLDMTKGKPFLLVLQFALPLFFGNLLQQFYNLADTAIAGHVLGDTALAEIGAVAALYGLITNFAFGMNNGLALSLSRSFGAGDEKKMKHATCWMVTISMSAAIVLMVIFLLCEKPLLMLLQVPDDTMAGAMKYLTIILIGIPFTMAYNMEAAMLQAVGNSMTPLLFLLFSSVLNITLDYVFMAPLAMGIGGAAFATVLSQGVSAFLAFLLIRRNYPLLHFKKTDYKVEKKFVLEMAGAGLSMALMSAIYNIGSVILQGSINALGNLYITAQVGARRLAELFHTPGLALGTSVATYTSQNMGGGNRSRIKKGVWSAFFMFAIWWVISMIFVTFLAEDAVRLVTGSSNAEIIYNTVLYLRISFPLIPTMAVIIILRNMLQGMNHLLMPLICSGLELLGKVVFAIRIVPVYGYVAVCVCEPATWIICCIFILICTFLCRKEFREI